MRQSNAAKLIKNMEQYTIMVTAFTCGTIAEKVKKENVRKECERLKTAFSISTHDYVQIEVMNNETGEVREFWNNKQNQELF